MKDSWRGLNDKFSSLSRRERILIALSIWVGLGLLAFTLIIEPQTKVLTDKTKRLSSSQQQVQTLADTIAQSQSQLRSDPNVALTKQIAELKAELSRRQAGVEGELADLILPEQMMASLAQLLGQANRVALIQLSIKPPQLLIPEGGLYRHGLELVLEGGYFDLLSTLQRMERLEQRFYWRHLDYQVTNYPSARLTVLLDTLGTEKEPIRVGTQNPGIVLSSDASR